jgi:glucose/arabinose dehydrogenase
MPGNIIKRGRMNGYIRLLVAAGLAALAVPMAAQQEVPMRGNTPVAPQGIKAPPLPDTPVRYETGEGQTIKVSVYARGFQNPWSMAFVSDDTILVAERGGAIKAVRNGVVDPTPVAGAPRAIGAGLSGTDLALHPDFARNHLVYISYTKPLDPPGAAPPPPAPAGGRGGRGAAPRTAVAVAVAVWNGKEFTGTRDIFVDEGSSGGPIVFGGDGMLYVARGGGDTQNPNSLAGKILRLTEEGKVPPDNPFVGRTDARPEIFTMGHRTFLRMAKHPQTGAIWQIENGPNGGDEVNILTPGSNYGWPLVSLGRTYAGPWQGPLSKEGFKDPIIYWMPAIAVSSITFYTGDRLPKWKGDVFVTGMRYGEIPGTGQLHRILINKNFEELRREALLVDLHAAVSRREAGTGRPPVSAHR